MRTVLPITALLLAIPTDGASAQSLPPLAEAEKSGLGYPTVDAAIAALRVKPGVTFATENGWLIATDEAELTV